MNKPRVRILSNLARAGGTLVSRCLGAMDDTVLLSEIHPLGTQIFNPLAQARDWYGLVKPEEAGGQFDFIDAIQLIEQRCRVSGKTLVIRDWAHLDFIGRPFIKDPACRLQLTETLATVFNIVQFALVRHPVDQWVSTSSLNIMQGQLELDTFLAGYRRFAEQAVKSGFMRFEDFTRDPRGQMLRLCQCLEISFDPDFIDHWQENTRVTGDVSKTSRGSRMNEIRPLRQHAVDDSLVARFRNNSDYRRAIELLGYTDPATVTSSGTS